MHYIVYKTTNVINGKYYIGAHQTSNIEDGYLGSGKALRRAIIKYGVEAFQREIISEHSNQGDMYLAEKAIVTCEIVSDKKSYNLTVGGKGGWYVTHGKRESQLEVCRKGREAANAKGAHIKGSITAHYKMRTDPEHRAIVTKAIRDGIAARDSSSFWKHTEDTKRKIGSANAINQIGSGNSNYGRKWIYNVDTHESRCIDSDDVERYTADGWKVGRKMKKILT